MTYRASRLSTMHTDIAKGKLLELLRAEREKAVERFKESVREARAHNIAVLKEALKLAEKGETPDCDWNGRLRKLFHIPERPERCTYDVWIERIEADVREEFTITSEEWSRLFPCKL